MCQDAMRDGVDPYGEYFLRVYAGRSRPSPSFKEPIKKDDKKEKVQFT